MATILVAEDSQVTAEMLDARLTNAGHVVVRAADGREALDRMTVSRFDLILLDVMMPELDGMQVLRRVKADPLWSVTPVMMLSARTQDRDMLAALAGGASDYVTKPFSFRELLARIDRVLSEGPDLLRIAVVDADGVVSIGELVHGDPTKAAVRFLVDGCPSFAIGDPATLSLSSPSIGAPIDLPSHVTARSEADPFRRYQFELDGDAGRETTNAFLRLIGRRGAQRHRFGPEEVVEAVAVASVGGDPVELSGRLQDISAGGTRLLLKGDADRLLVGVDAFDLHFQLPHADELLVMRAGVRHREASPEGTAYGLLFEAHEDGDLLEQQEQITEFLILAQDEEGD